MRVFTPADSNRLHAMKQSTPKSDAEREAEAKEESPGPPRRPLSVTIASWFLIYWPVTAVTVVASVEVFAFFDSKSTKQVLRPNVLLGVASSMLIILWFGIGMLRGLRWTRVLWLGVGPAVIVLTYLREPDQAVLSLILYVIYAVILNTRAARLYFTRGGFF